MTTNSSGINSAIAVFNAEASTQHKDILSYLSNKGYQLSTISTPEDKKRLTENTAYDAIISLTPASDLEYFRIFHEQSPDDPYLRPLLVVISEDFEGNLPTDYADIILPPIAKYIDYQLQTVLRLRTETTALRKKNQTLKSEISQLRCDLKDQKHSSDAVEILKNAIVRNVSHELKTPLLQVKAAVALLAEDSTENDLIAYATNATARLELLVKNITLLGTSLDINPSPVIVRDAIEYARRNIGRIWEHRNESGRLKLNVEENLPPTLVDKQGLSTVLQLLIDNALKFSKDDVKISATRHDSAFIKIVVEDNGIGIAQDQLDSIFEIFYQIDASSTRRYGGTGVGLAIVKLILDGHECVIHVESTVGEGSVFWFMLPIAEI